MTWLSTLPNFSWSHLYNVSPISLYTMKSRISLRKEICPDLTIPWDLVTTHMMLDFLSILLGFYLFTFQTLSPFTVFPPQTHYSIPSPCFCEGAHLPTLALPPHRPSISLCWSIEPCNPLWTRAVNITWMALQCVDWLFNAAGCCLLAGKLPGRLHKWSFPPRL